ncbi:MAG: porin [Methylobacter sp.]|uniref:Porin n=1 Tax=Candidatus Methylobacter titanis TaxID=3053457 RepID=A0AA43TKB9_9GAMM|nr:porin [Candidatus Methylobacter titanis]MDI1292943.1 porin [Candidatus Methylobacter titanis]
MKSHLRKNAVLQLTLCSAVLCSSLAQADDDKGAVESLTGFNINETAPLKDLGINVGGWVSSGVSGNIDSPEDRFNGPVTFGDRANEFHMQQLNGYIERAVDTEGKKWDLGFRADILYGTDARFTTQANFDNKLILDSDSRFYKLAFPQVYATVFAPIGNGLTTKIGHFYTIIGNEVVTAPDNFFFSHAYTMQYGEPFTHTGIISSYPVNDNISLTGGVVSGWDSFFQEPANFLGGATFTTDNKKTSLAFSVITGDVQKLDKHNRTMYSVVLSHDITDTLHYKLQHDLGIEEKSTSADSAKWYGINQYLTYDINDKLGAGVRLEWFRDEDGARVSAIGNGNTMPGGQNHYLAATAGLNYSPISWLTLRPEVRYDHSTENNAYNAGLSNDQLLISADATVRF